MKAKKTNKELLTDESQVQDTLTPKQELFCRLYTQNKETFGNATWSYAEAYGYDLDSLSKEVEKDEKKSEYDLGCNVCAVEGKKLLRKPQINARVNSLLKEMLTEDVIDTELSYVATQKEDLGAKMRAINEFNKLKGRIVEKVQANVVVEEKLTEAQKKKLESLYATGNTTN